MTDSNTSRELLASAGLHRPRGRHSDGPRREASGLAATWQASASDLARLVAAMGCGHAAEDILQSVYLVAMSRSPKGLSHEELRRWLFRVTINRCRQEHRRHDRARRVLAGLAGWMRRSNSVQPAADTAADRQQRQAVTRALEAMDDDLRTPLVLRYFLDMNSGEIGRILGMPDTTVRTRLRAGRQRLADQLRRAGYGHE